MNLLEKKISELTPEDLNELSMKFGTSGLPYPAGLFDADAPAGQRMDIGMIADDTHPLIAYSNRSHDYVVGQFYRRMAIPSLWHFQKEALLRRAPESKSRVMIILGTPGAGKSEGVKTIADACDDRGVDIVDCGGRYLGDLLWEQMIDYGDDFKTALTGRICSGILTEPSIRAIDKKFPKALIRDDEGRIKGIDWNQTIDNAIDPDAALRQSVAFAKDIAEFEGIPTQTVNSIGIKRTPGVIKRWHEEGRSGLLDEYTKSIEGSDDSLQTVLQYLNGEIDEATVTSTLKVAGREETYSYTLKRSDMRAGFFVYMAGNNKEDGVSTHALSQSAYSRLPVFKIETISLRDWEHRISQALTGLPLSTLYSVFSGFAKDDPEEFTQMLMELRLMGLSADQQAGVPSHQLTMLGNWDRTNEAIRKYAALYAYLEQIVDPQSELFNPEKPQNNTNINLILPEISAFYRDESAIDFRKPIQDIAEASKMKPLVQKIEGGSSFRLNFSEVARKKAAPAGDSKEDISARFGSRLEATTLERIIAMTQGRPNLQDAMIKEARHLGALTIDPTKEQQTISKLLNQDMYAGVGGIETVIALQRALVARLKQANPGLRGKPDNEVMPMDKAIDACERLSRLSSEAAASATPRTGKLVTLGETLSSVFNKVSAVDGIGGENRPAPDSLVTSSDFLESLRIPAIADINMKGIWRDTISAEKLVKPTKETTPLVELAEGKSPSKIGITTIMLRSSDNDNVMVPTHILRDETRKKTLIVTDAASAATKSALGSHFTIVSYDDAAAESQVAAFIKETLQHPSRETGLPDLEKQLSHAFVLRAGNEGQLQPLAQMMTTRDLPADAPVYMVKADATPRSVGSV